VLIAQPVHVTTEPGTVLLDQSRRHVEGSATRQDDDDLTALRDRQSRVAGSGRTTDVEVVP
jgi:hypothetical protein